MNNMEKYTNIFVKVFGVEPSDLNEKFTFADTEAWDSLAHMTLITELEDTFDVMFEPEDILHYESFLNGKHILEQYGVDFSSEGELTYAF